MFRKFSFVNCNKTTIYIRKLLPPVPSGEVMHLESNVEEDDEADGVNDVHQFEVFHVCDEMLHGCKGTAFS